MALVPGMLGPYHQQNTYQDEQMQLAIYEPQEMEQSLQLAAIDEVMQEADTNPMNQLALTIQEPTRALEQYVAPGGEQEGNMQLQLALALHQTGQDNAVSQVCRTASRQVVV